VVSLPSGSPLGAGDHAGREDVQTVEEAGDLLRAVIGAAPLAFHICMARCTASAWTSMVGCEMTR
jgi:hypothetical protein